MSRRPQTPFDALMGRFWAVVFVMSFWTVGLVAIKLAMPLMTVVVVIYVVIAAVRWWWARWRGRY